MKPATPFARQPAHLAGLIGLAVGLYHYLAVWIHYWATEKPDIAMIYGDER